MREHGVQMLWKEYDADQMLALDFPERWELSVSRLRDVLTVDEEEIAQAVKNPIGTSPLRELARGRRSECILVDDVSRPMETFRIAAVVVQRLASAGVGEDQIFFVVANGGHRPQTHNDPVKKLGQPIVERFMIYNHRFFDNLVDMGVTKSGNKLFVNRLFAEADLKLAIGCAVSHALAGFGGRGKIALPVVCGIQTIARNQRPPRAFRRTRIGVTEGNVIRQEMDEVAMRVGLEFIANTVVNSRSETAAIFAGIPLKPIGPPVGPQPSSMPAMFLITVTLESSTLTPRARNS